MTLSQDAVAKEQNTEKQRNEALATKIGRPSPEKPEWYGNVSLHNSAFFDFSSI